MDSDHFGDLLRHHAIWIDDFNGDDKADVLLYDADAGNWWLATCDGQKLTWGATPASSVPGFGNLLDGGHAIWIGDFNGDRKADVLFYAADGNWWLGICDGQKLTWGATPASSVPGFGNLLDGGHAIWIGDFNGDRKADVLFYAEDNNWWLGTCDGQKLTWGATPASSVPGFGNLLDGGHAIWIGDFTGDRKADVLFYTAGDGNWWLGICDGQKLTWGSQPASNTGARPQDSSLLRWPTIEYTDSNGYEYVETADWWKQACVVLPCFAALEWPGYATKVIEGTIIDGQPVVIQLWKGLCEKFLDLKRFPGGFGAEVGVYRRIPGRVRPASLPFLPPTVAAFLLGKIATVSDTELWWPLPGLGARIEFSLINPLTNQAFFNAEAETTYWLCKWMNGDSYAKYQRDQARWPWLPLWVPGNSRTPIAVGYSLEFTINGRSFPRW